MEAISWKTILNLLLMLMVFPLMVFLQTQLSVSLKIISLMLYTYKELITILKINSCTFKKYQCSLLPNPIEHPIIKILRFAAIEHIYLEYWTLIIQSIHTTVFNLIRDRHTLEANYKHCKELVC